MYCRRMPKPVRLESKVTAPLEVQAARHESLMPGRQGRASVKRLRDEAESIEEEAGSLKETTLLFCPVQRVGEPFPANRRWQRYETSRT